MRFLCGSGGRREQGDMTAVERFDNFPDSLSLWRQVHGKRPGLSLEALSELLVREAERFGHFEQKGRLLDVFIGRSEKRVALQRDFVEKVKGDEALLAVAEDILESLMRFHELLLDTQARLDRTSGSLEARREGVR